MGVRDLLRKLMGGDAAPASPWAAASDEDLARAWRAGAALSRAALLAVRDALVARRLPLPFSEAPPPDAPTLPEADARLEPADLLAWLRGLDPYADREPDAVRVWRGGALVPCGGDGLVAVLLPAWRRDDPAAFAPPALRPGEAVRAVVVAGGEGGWLPLARILPALGAARAPIWTLDRGGAADRPLPGEAAAEGLAPAPLPDALDVDDLHLARVEGAPGVVDLSDANDDFRVLAGPRVPVTALGGEVSATHVVGGLRAPVTEEELAALETAGWGPAAVLDLEAVCLLHDAADADAPAASRVAVALRAPAHAVGPGAPAPSWSHGVLDALLAADGEAVAAAAAEAEPEALVDAGLWVAREGRLDLLEALADAMAAARGPSATATWLRGLAADVRGDHARARALYDEAAGDEPRATLQRPWLAWQAGDREAVAALAAEAAEAAPGDAVAQANHALAVWMAGDRDGAYDLVQASHVAAGSWLGATLDATVHAGDPDRDGFGVFSWTGAVLAPYEAALDHLRAGHLDEGERLLRRALALDPHHPAASGQLALHLARSGRADEAIAVLDGVLAARPRAVYHRALRGTLHLEAGRDEPAAHDLREALDAMPDTPAWRLDLILAFERLGRKDAALAEIDALDEDRADMALLAALRKRLA